MRFRSIRNSHAAAGEAIACAFAEIQHVGFGALATQRFDRLLKTLRQLSVAEARLDGLRRPDLRV